jgi:hypothetical protein
LASDLRQHAQKGAVGWQREQGSTEGSAPRRHHAPQQELVDGDGPRAVSVCGLEPAAQRLDAVLLPHLLRLHLDKLVKGQLHVAVLIGLCEAQRIAL